MQVIMSTLAGLLLGACGSLLLSDYIKGDRTKAVLLWGTAILGVATLIMAGTLFAEDPPLITAVSFYEPWTETGVRDDIRVISMRDGVCFYASRVNVGRSDAFRCLSGQMILDPCFVGPAFPRREALCPVADLSEAILLRVKGDFPSERNPDSAPRSLPWRMELIGSIACTREEGALPDFAGQRLAYSCSNERRAAGTFDRRSGAWKVFVLDEDERELVLVPVTVAYF